MVRCEPIVSLDNLRACPLCASDQPVFLYRPARAPGPVSRCSVCGMVYVSTVQEARGLIEDGPVWAGDSRILTSSNLEEVLGS